MDKTEIVSVGDSCYQTYPCQHDCILLENGKLCKRRMFGDAIIEYWDQLSLALQKHFHYLNESLVLKSQ